MTTIALLNDYVAKADQFKQAYLHAASATDSTRAEKLGVLFTRIQELESSYKEAVGSLAGRSQLLLQKQHASLAKLFPAPLPKRQTDQSRSSSVVVAFPEQNPIELATLNPKASLEEWGDWLMGAEWMIIDILGTLRNGGSVGAAVAGASTPAWMVAAIPLMQVFGGLLCMHSAIRDTIPGAWNELQKAIRLGEQEGITVARISLANQIFFAGIGAALGAAGVVGMMTPAVADILGYAPVLSAAGGATAELAITGFWGGACLLRGMIMVGRGLYNLSYINPFHEQFEQAIRQPNCTSGKIESGLTMLEREWGDGSERDIEHFKRRAGAEATAKMQEYMKNRQCSDEKKIELLAVVDKGIATQKFKQGLIILIGALMILGAIACIVFSGGLTGMLVLAAIGTAFTLMEANWVIFDCTWLFNKLADWKYQEPEYISSLRNPSPAAAASEVA